MEKHLKPLMREYNLTSWYDRKILPGEDWAESIDQHLNTADIILLLVSPDFMASDYCYGKEMQLALERHRLGACRVVPILLRSVYWKKAPFAFLQMLPFDAEPVSLWSDRDKAFHTIVEDISIVIEAMIREKEPGTNGKLSVVRQSNEVSQEKEFGTKGNPSFARQPAEISSNALVPRKEKTNTTIIDLCIEVAKALGAYDHPISLKGLRGKYLRAYPDIQKGKPKDSLEAAVNYHTINMQSRFHYPQNKRKPDVWQSRPVFKRVAPELYMLLSDEEISRFRQFLKEGDERIYQSEYDVDALLSSPNPEPLDESPEE